MAQDQINISGGGDSGESEPGDAQNAGQVNVNTTGTDDLLDEIDALLDTNAEEFVRSYVQKGGQ